MSELKCSECGETSIKALYKNLSTEVISCYVCIRDG